MSVPVGLWRALASAQKQPPASVEQARLLCKGLRARGSPAFALSRWTRRRRPGRSPRSASDAAALVEAGFVNPRDHERRAEHAKTGSAADGPCRRARLLGGAGLLLGGRDAMCHWQEPPRDESGFRAHGSNQRFHRLQRHTVLRPRRDQAAPTLTALPSARRSTSQSSRSTSGSSTTPLTRRTPRPARSAPAASATTGWTRRPRRRWRSRGASCASRACSATAPAPGARHRRADEPGREERGGKLHPRFGISGSSVASSLQ